MSFNGHMHIILSSIEFTSPPAAGPSILPHVPICTLSMISHTYNIPPSHSNSSHHYLMSQQPFQFLSTLLAVSKHFPSHFYGTCSNPFILFILISPPPVFHNEQALSHLLLTISLSLTLYLSFSPFWSH